MLFERREELLVAKRSARMFVGTQSFLRRPTSHSFRFSIPATHLRFLTRAQHRHHALTSRDPFHPGRPALAIDVDWRRRPTFPRTHFVNEYGAGWPLGCARLAAEIKGPSPSGRPYDFKTQVSGITLPLLLRSAHQFHDRIPDFRCQAMPSGDKFL